MRFGGDADCDHGHAAVDDMFLAGATPPAQLEPGE